MNTEMTIIASIFLLLGGLAAFPFTLDYSNTSWMPRWMRPDVDYLERPFRYDYPGRGMQIIFSLLVLFVGAMSLLTLLDKNLSQTVTPGQWFDSMSLVLPACQVSCILFMRQEYNDPFEYADRLTGFSMWKVTAALCLIPLLWLPYVAGLLDSSMYRFTVLSYNLLAYAFLVYDYIRVYRKRFDYEYTGHVGLKGMYPESLYLLAYPVCSVTLLWSLWQNKEVCILVYSVALIIFSLTKTVCRFHPAIRGDEHERCEYLWYRPREMTTDRAKRICSQIQKGRGIFADARPYYVVVSRRCHSTRYQFQLTTEGEHQKRILLDGNIRVLICRKFDSLSAAGLYRLQLVEQYWNTYYNNFFRYESRARSEFEEELKCDGTGEKESGSSI